MLKLIRRPIGPGGRRRGVTLVEMLVVVALVVLMMVILVQIFQAATGAMSASRTIQELDVTLRQVDSIIRSDLAGVTACMDPMAGQNDPKLQRGYFEYGENAFADAQGEDTDDYLAFTTRAPEGQTFSGRQWLVSLPGEPPINQNVQPTTINSSVAEVIYFLRNGNLYRRVFLVAPERAKSLRPGTQSTGGQISTLFGGLTPVSWQGVNGISCRPAGYNPSSRVPIPNDLSHLTNRENRAFRPRFQDDYTTSASTGSPDGIPDDNNLDNVPDYYPTLYTDGRGGYGVNSTKSGPNAYVQDQNGDPQRVNSASYDVYAFPFIYPGMYSVPDTARLAVAGNLGWIHGLQPATVGTGTNKSLVSNHGALDIGDNLATPAGQQTWWGFPTWRETMTGTTTNVTTGWTDPFVSVSTNGLSQPLGLKPFPPNLVPNRNSANFLPPLTVGAVGNTPPYADVNAGSTTFVAIPANPGRVWEDDLLLSGVRSFDVKAYDENAPLYNTPQNGFFSAGYYDLGYGSSYFGRTGDSSNGTGSFNYLGGPNGVGATAQVTVPWQAAGTFGPGAQPVGLGHEGRMPPLVSDFRQHPRRGYNIGDDGPGVLRLARVWDSWSTDYTNAPDSDLYLHNLALATPSPIPACYPSFPPPYAAPLRGLQIQIRLVDARGEKAKPITIRHDFTDKLN